MKLVEIEPRDWMKLSLCSQVDPELWFPDYQRSPEVKVALKICADCPVRQECRDYGDEIGAEWGIWGGEVRGTNPRTAREHRWEARR